jgi:uncharacterized membrane protein
VRLKFLDRTLDLLPLAAATLLVAGIVHIVSVLLMPGLATRDAYARVVAAVGDAEGLKLLPETEPGAEILPFEDPAFAAAVCVFDLSKGMVRLAADADGEEMLTVSFIARGGRVFHAVTDKAAIQGKIDIVVGDARQIEALEDNESDAPPQQVRLTAPGRRGFALLRAFAKRPSDMARARERLAAAVCARFEPPKN